MQRIRNSTRSNYYAIWKKFNQFIIRLDHKPDNWEECITLYIGYLIDNNKRSQTIRSYVSALKSILADIKIKINQDQFLFSALMRACKFKNDKANMRQPIRKPMLRVILQKTMDYFMNELNQPYLAITYTTLFSTAYFGLFRVGELTSGSHPVLVTNVYMVDNKNKVLFILKTSKTHGEYSRPQSIKINSTSSQGADMEQHLNNFCPYRLLRNYIKIRPKYRSTSEPFFIFYDFSPITPIHMRSTLNSIINMAGFDSDLYNCSSFRIGRASDMLKMGISVETIKLIGRWTSNVVFTYLRTL